MRCVRELTESHTCLQSLATGLSHTAYDLLRIGAWALVIFGAVLVVTGLIRCWTSQARP